MAIDSDASATGLSLLINWANEQDHWLRGLAAEIVETRRPLSDARVTHFVDLLQREKELVDAGSVAVAQLSAGSTSRSDAPPLVLTSLAHKENVNALAANQEIEFNPRMTVLFGENASGKTGYVRILKRAAAVRTAEPILPDIHGGSAARTPHVILGFRLGSEAPAFVEWRGEQGVDPLTRIGVFDSRGAVVHLEEDLTYAYTPGDLALFPLAHDGIERVRAKMEAAQREATPKGNPFVSRFPRESRLLPKIESLGPSTDLKALEDLARVTEDEEASLPGLREKVDALRSGSAQARLEIVRRDKEVYARAAGAAQTLRDFDHAAYAGALATLRDAEAAQARATRDAFAADALPGVLGDSWRAFIDAAEEYIKANGLDPYPASGEPCIYCRQPLRDAAVALVQKYRAFRNDALRAAVDDGRRALDAMTGSVRDTDPEGLMEDIQRLMRGVPEGEALPPSLANARSLAEELRATRAAILAANDCPPPSLHLEAVGAVLRQRVADLASAAEDLARQGADRARALAAESAKLRDLEDRLVLRSLLPGISSHVTSVAWADRVNAQLGRFQGIKKGLTEVSKRASAEILDRDFERSFTQECEALRAPRVTLAFPGREGAAKRRKLLTPGHELGEVLSEGEQKVVALADFLAEASLRRDSSPIVLDDPVTSLDHKRLQHVVDRLVALSRARQVIVFTHDIWFAAELLARFEREPAECAFYDVTNEEGRIGAVTRGSHPRTDTFNDRRRRLQRLIEAAEGESGETRQAMVEKGYEELRGACETVVEKDILRGVTERYRPNVRMTVLGQIHADRLPAAVAVIGPVFENCCRMIASHSQPLATLGIRPTLDGLKQDWQALRSAREEYVK
ncbi:MAG: AAA family ATPase [Anaerolineales bacterium]|nr:AAA family ATPase [Anaerolineales bacterium]